MKQKQTFFICLFIGLFSMMNAQKLELGKVTLAELEEKVFSKDPLAEAAFIFRKGEVRFEYSQNDGFVMFTEVKVKIKIYSKEGYKWANHDVQYYLVGDSKENVSFSDVATYNLEGGKIIKTKMKSDGEFEEKVNRYWARKKITLPNVKEGSIIEYSYLIKSPNFITLRDWDFQSSIPTVFSEFKTYVPEYFIYNPNQKGFVFPKTTVAKVNKTISYTYRDNLSQSGSVVNSASQEKLNFVETQTTYTAENLAAMKEESFVNNFENYVSSISHELSIVQYPNSPLKTFSTDWETVTRKIYENDDFGAELNKTGYFDAEITAITKGLTTRNEIISAIFNHVKTNVKWNGLNDYYCHNGVKQAHKNKTGNVAEINLMLTAMLRFAGIDANPVLVSTRSNGIALFPSRTGFNYVITAVEIEDALILLDATEKYSSLNILPVRDLNWYGRLIRKEGTSAEVDLMPKNLSKENHNISYKINDNGTIAGKIRTQYTDYNALNFRQTKISLAKETYVEELENKRNSIDIEDYVRDNDLDVSKPIVESYSFNGNNSAEIIGGKIYVAPLLFLTSNENPFKLEKREYPIDFSFPFQEKFLINVEIPEGYTVESIPKSVNMVTGDEIGSFKYLSSTVENKIQVSITFEIHTAIVGADYYEVIKDFYQKVIDKQNEKIVLVKS